MASDASEFEAAQVKLMEKRRALGIPERASPSPDPKRASECTEGLAEPAKRFIDSLSADQRARLEHDLTHDPPDVALTPAVPPTNPAELVKQSAASAHAREEARTPSGSTAAPSKRRRVEAGRMFGMLFLDLVSAPQFRRLRQRDLLTLCILIAYRDGATGEAAPGRGSIARLIEVEPRTVDRSLNGLKRAGLIRQTRRACHGRNASYRIAENEGEIEANLKANCATPNIVAQSCS